MILTPQEAKVMDGRPLDSVILSLQKALAVNGLVPLQGSDRVYAVIEINENIPAFNLPITVFDAMGRKKICIDIRNGRREFQLDEMTRSYKPTLLTETNFLTNLSLAMLVWQNGPADFNNIYYDAGRVYAMWLAMKVTKRLVLTPQQQNELMVYFAYYWLTRIDDAEILNENLYQFILNKISILFGMNMNEVATILSKTNKVNYKDIDVFCKALAENIDSPKMKHFNRILLQTITLGSWFGGLNAKEITSVAVEYPPLFMTLIYRALNERSFKNSDITQVALKLLPSAKQNQYSLIFSDLLNRAVRS